MQGPDDVSMPRVVYTRRCRHRVAVWVQNHLDAILVTNSIKGQHGTVVLGTTAQKH
jgi:hypothetical protein